MNGSRPSINSPANIDHSPNRMASGQMVFQGLRASVSTPMVVSTATMPTARPT